MIAPPTAARLVSGEALLDSSPTPAAVGGALPVLDGEVVSVEECSACPLCCQLCAAIATSAA